MRLSSGTTRTLVLKISVTGLGLVVLTILCLTIIPALLSKGTGQLSIVYPFDGSTFPPEIVAPTIWWEDSNPSADSWRVTLTFQDGGEPITAITDSSVWTPDHSTWEIIKRRSKEQAALITVASLQNLIVTKRTLSTDAIHIATSRDSVGAPIFYRDVPLPFRFALRNVPMIRWRLGDISSDEPPPTVLTNLPVCGNCHTFSADGKTLGMDVDIGNDKGAYVLTRFEEETVLSRDKLVSWSDFVRDEKVPTFGMLPNVSPCGQYVLAGVKDRTVFLPREDLMFSQIFFPVMGIVAYYDHLTNEITALPGADDEDYVQSNAVWDHDGQYVIFARSKAVRLQTDNPNKGILLNTEESIEVLGGEQFLHNAQEGANPFRFGLYRVPFNDGKGGKPEPIPGASHNGMSNFFPKVSPDGRWLVFTQAHSYMLLQPDSKLYIIPATGGEPRLMNANTDRMNSWHSWSPNSKWLVFSTKVFGPYTQLFLTHIDEDGNDSPPVWLRNFTASDRAANIPEFVNIPSDARRVIQEQFVDDYSYFRSGRIYQQFREYDRAEEDFLKSLQLNPANTFALYSLGTMYADREDYDKAELFFDRILAVDPDAAIVRKDLGSLYFASGEYDKAQEQFEAAVRLDPQNVAAIFNLATIHLMKRRLVDAERQFLRLLALDTDAATAARVHMHLARIHVTRRDYAKVIGEYLAVLALDSANVEARHNLGVTYRAINDLVSAQGVFEELVRLQPDNVEARLELGQVYAHRGAYAPALEELEAVLRVDPANVPALLYSGRIHYQTGELELAEQLLLRAAAENPNNVYVHVELGRVCYEIGKWAAAVQEFSWVTRARPDDANAHFMLAEALTREGRSIQEAIEAFKQGLALDPAYVEGHVSLGDLYVRLESYAAALAEFEAALRLEPDDPGLTDYLNTRIADLRRRGTGR